MLGANHFQDIILIDPLCGMILWLYKKCSEICQFSTNLSPAWVGF